MIYKEFCGEKVSLLGFGTMRLPTLEGGTVDVSATREMVRYAMNSGVNYFDTAYPYHSGESEYVIGKILAEYPRESFYLADKFPGHQTADSYDPSVIFEEQLKKCGVDYFDFYLLHNVYENSIDVYKDPKWNILGYFKEQKRLGRIKHLGFSTHGRLDMMKDFLEFCGEDMEFCQIQLNYLDWTLQNAKEKLALLNEWNIPVIVMEPLRGGKLSKLADSDTARLKELSPDESPSALAFRFMHGMEGVKVILSGMSNTAQLEENVKTFGEERPLSDAEKEVLFEVAENIKGAVPCTACRYCVDGCPAGLDIPMLIGTYNETLIAPTTVTVMHLEALDETKMPSACISCGLCTNICPQKIDVPDVMKKLSDTVASLPKWSEVSRARAKEQMKYD